MRQLGAQRILLPFCDMRVPCAPACAPALKSALDLRGGEAQASALLHSVLLSLVSNAMAVAVSSILTDESLRHSPLSRAHRWGHLLLRAFVVAMVAYAVVYACTGFVPMGYVQGSAPLLGFFSQRN